MTQQKAGYPSSVSKEAGETGKDRLRQIADTAGNQLKDASEQAQEIAGRVADHAREYGEKAQEVAGDMKAFVNKSLKEQPMATLAGAALIGFVLGALWKK
jgi:ElaB/YqjD/DUF883 family membrane-anchored ribosome-binding protein